MVGIGANGAIFTGSRGATPPMGVVIDNLPYILLILLVIAALAAYVVSRSRRRSHEAS
jgi:hypothetical protein